MNNERRKALAAMAAMLEPLLDQLSDIVTALDDIRDAEQETFDNMPESLQGGERGEKAQAAIDAIDEAISCIDTDEMREALAHIETARE